MQMPLNPDGKQLQQQVLLFKTIYVIYGLGRKNTKNSSISFITLYNITVSQSPLK